eukprot:jgi/Mesen1/6434/ME000033S05720
MARRGNDGSKTTTPLPMGPMAALSVALFSNSLSMTFLFPFVPIMVASFHVTDDQAKVGSLSDRIGRKPVMLIGLVSNIAFAVVFGLSTSLLMAMLARFCQGVLATVIATSKTVTAELCDASNQHKGFAFMSLNWGLGLLIGPVFGGFLSQPADKYPWAFSQAGVFGVYPFLLPSVIVALLASVGLVLALIYLPETLGWVQPKTAATAAEGSAAAATPSASASSGQDVGEIGAVEVDVSRRPNARSENGAREPLLAKTEAGAEGGLGASDLPDPGYWKAVFGERDTVVATLLYGLCGFMFIAYDELFPLWSLSDWKVGGLNFGTNNVGLAQAASGVAMIPITLWLYPQLVESLGPLAALRMSLCTGILQGAIPLIRLLGPNPVLLQVASCVIFAIRSFNESAILALFILCSNSVKYPQYMGAVNGFVWTTGSTFRAIAPFTVGSIFAWSASRHGTFPLDFHFAWLLLGALHIVALLLSLLLPPSINERKFEGALH